MLDMLSMREKQKLLKEMNNIKDEPDSRKIPALLWRLKLLELEKLERNNSQKKKLVELYKSFCISNSISLATLYRKQHNFRRKGIQGLLPNYGNNRIHNRKVVGAELLEIRHIIDIKNPIVSIIEIVNSICKSKFISPPQRGLLEKLLDYLDSIKSFRGVNNSLRVNRKLSEEELILLHELKSNLHRNIARRAIVIDMFLNKEPLFNIVQKSQRVAGTIYKWKIRFEAEGMKFFSMKYNEEGAKKISEERKNRIAKIIHYPPNHFDINRSSWSLDSLVEVYQKEHKEKINPHAISKAIKEMGYTFKKAKKVLTSEDPHYQEKVDAIKSIKKSLDVNASFYFIDEAGPWAIKKYGGKSIHAPGEIKTYPQYPKKKGSITFIGAYEATKKIILWQFISQKNSEAVIEILKLIIRFTQHKEKVYVTWDSASWHDSKSLKEFIEIHNASSVPAIIVLPLPSKAQYLNTIESYFSGMKRAIIHNSDYQSSDEMIVAIERYFREKNLKNLNEYLIEKNKNIEADFESGLHKKIN